MCVRGTPRVGEQYEPKRTPTGGRESLTVMGIRPTMTCSEFVAHFSDLHDGTASADLACEMEEHLQGCSRCRRYRRVVERGAAVLRSFPGVRLREDFRPRLQHRLYHVDDETALRSHAASGASALAVAGIAVLLVAVAWAPALRPGQPVVELAPVIVSRPPPVRDESTRVYLFQSQLTVTPVRSTGLWDDAPSLMFEYSRLSQRYRRTSAVQRAGLDQDR